MLRLTRNVTDEAIHRGDAFFLQGKLKKAREEFRLAAQADPTWGEAHYKLGKVHYVLGDDDLARRCLKKAVRYAGSRSWNGTEARMLLEELQEVES